MLNVKNKAVSKDTELPDRTLIVFLGGHLYYVWGNWHCDLQSDDIFCSDVLLSVAEQYPSATRCLLHPDDNVLIREFIRKIQKSESCDASFRIISSYGQVFTITTNGWFSIEEEIETDPLVHSPLTNYIRDKFSSKQSDLDEIQLQAYQNVERITASGVWHINTVTYDIFYSDGIFHLHGLPGKSLNVHLHTFHSFIYPADREAVIRAFDVAYKQQVPLSLEYRIQVNQDIKWISHVTKWIFNSKGELILTGVMQDISSQKLSTLENESLKLKAKLKDDMLMHSEGMARLANWHLDLLTRRITYSNNIYRIYGIKPGNGQLNLNLLLKYVHPEDVELVKNFNHQITYEQAATDVEYRIVRPDGKTRYLRQKGKLIIDAQDEMEMIGTIMDITEIMISERKLLKAKSRLSFQQFIDSHVETYFNTGSWVMDMDTGDVSWSKGMPELLGFRTGSIQFNQRVLLSVIHPEDKKNFVEQLAMVQQGGPEADFIFRITHKNETRNLHTHLKIVNFEESRIFIGTFQDKTAEIALKQQLTEQFAMAEMLNDASMDRVYVTDLNNYIVRWNHQCEETYGFKKEKVIGRNFFEVFPQLKTPEILGRFQKVFRGETVRVKNEKAFITGGFQDILMLPIKDDKQIVLGVLVIVHDITHEFELRKQLTERLLFIEKLLELSVDRIIALDRNMNYRYWNKKAEQYYGISRNEVVGRNILELFPGFIDDPSYESFRNALRGETVHIPASKNLDNKKGYFETFLVPVKDDKNNEVTGILWIVHDLAGEYRLALQQRKANYILESINECYAEVDFNGTVRYINSRAENYWHKTRQELLGQNIADLFSGNTEALPIISQALENKQENSGEFYSPYNERWMFLSCKVTNEGVILIFSDITERVHSENALNENRNLLQSVFDTAFHGTVIFNAVRNDQSEIIDLEFQFANQQFVDTGGKELFLDSACLLFSKSGRNEVYRKFIHVIETGEQADFEAPCQNGNEIRWFRFMAVKLNDGLVVGLEDITERKRNQHELSGTLNSLELQNVIHEHAEEIANIGTWVWNPETNEAKYSKRMFELFGMVENEVKPGFDTILQFIEEEDRKRMLQSAEDIKKGNIPVVIDYRVTRKDGAKRIFRNRIKLLIRSNGEKIIVGTTQDVTEEMQMRKQLEERTRYAENIIDASTNRIMVYDPSFTIIGWNRKSEEEMHISKAEIIGKKIYDVFPKVWEDKVLQDAYKSASLGKFIHLKPKKSTHLNLYYERFFIPLENEKGDTYAVLNMMNDVTELVLSSIELSDVNKTLERKNIELSRMNDEITSFTFVASHDMKEPLRKAHTFADWLLISETANLSAQGKDVLKKLSKSITRMNILIDDILVMAKIHSGERHNENVDLNIILQAVQEDFEDRISSLHAQLHIHKMPIVYGNTNQLKILFRNLVENALTFQASGNIPVISITQKKIDGKHVSLPGADIRKKYIVVSIEDNGVGFDDQFTEKMFRMFQRLHAQDEFAGTGMGLAICKKIMDIHDGMINASGTPGKGAIFNCYFPIK